MKDKTVEFHIAPMTMEHYDAVYQLWRRIDGLGLRSLDDSREGIRRFLARNPGLSVVALSDHGREGDGQSAVIGSILCGEDGRRGCLYHVCVDKSCRRSGVGSAMVERCLRSLRESGVNKVNLIAFADNDLGNSFWRSEKWTRRDDFNYYDMTLNEENTTSFVR